MSDSGSELTDDQNIESDHPDDQNIESDHAADDSKEFLFDGSDLTVMDFEYLFLIFGAKHSLADNVKKGLLELFQLVLLNENKVPSLYKLEKLVGSIGIQPKL